jgi:predicted DNA-binding ribbon-helix-helix protein
MKKIKILTIIILVIICCSLPISAYNHTIQIHKQFWDKVCENLLSVNDEISQILNQTNDTEDVESSLRLIVLTYEDTGSILDYNSKNLFDWYDSTGIWGTIANKVFSMVIYYSSTKELSQDDTLYLTNLKLANEELLETLQSQSSSLYINKTYQTEIINNYSNRLKN